MKIRILILSLTVLLLYTMALSAQEFPAKGNLRLDIDFARFHGDDSSVFLEAYYSFRNDEIIHKYLNEKYVGGINILMELSQTDKVLEKLEWTIPSNLIDTSNINTGKTLVGVKSFLLKPGEYILKIFAYDLNNPARTDSLSFPLKISLFPKDRDALSDPELCTSIKQIPKDTTNIFYKNTVEAIPNASLLYGTGLPILYYYVEAYNLQLKTNSQDYVLRITVHDATGKEVIKQEKSKKRLNASSVEIGTINTNSLKGGTYTFRISLMDTVNKTTAVASKKFFIYKPSDTDKLVPLTAGGMVSSEYALMNLEDLDNDFAVAHYVATEDEMIQYSKLTLVDAKRKFLFEFWKRRDTDPVTGVNEFKIDYMKRVDYANSNFGGAFKKGWKTDRGRVYIVYGPPDDVERYPSSQDSEAYEIWNYNSLQSGVVFIFLDRSGQSDYRLVHSNHRNELTDENWYQKAKKGR
jgi:GWxTD domain-containing protein